MVASRELLKQCDQIWRNFVTLAKIKKYLAIFKGLFGIWHSCEPTLGQFVLFWANFPCRKWPNLEETILPCGQTVR